MKKEPKNFEFYSDPDLEKINIIYDLKTKNRIKTFLDLEKFAASGSKVSLLYISDMFMRGVDLPDIIAKCKHWSDVARELNIVETSYKFGFGFYRLQDYASAFDAFSWGSDKNYAPSVYRLANMYCFGIFVDKDINKGRYLLELAARQKHVFAKKDLVYVLLTNNFGFIAKIRAVLMYFTLVYYQAIIVIKILSNKPLDEKYYR